MISFAYAPPCGSAVSLALRFAASVESWVLLRRADALFAGHDDPDAAGIGDGEDPDAMLSVLDFVGLVDGVPAWYALYVQVDGEWSLSGEPVAVTPQYRAEPLHTAPDLADLLRTRLTSGLQAEVLAGRLSHDAGAIPVLSANPLMESIRLPVVTVILATRRAEVRGIGETVAPDAWDGDFWSVFEGWLDRSTVEIVVWAFNHDDRVRLRDAVQRVLMLNLPILDAAGFLLPDLSESDLSDFETYSAPVYRSAFTLSCLHASLVRALATPIRSVEVQSHAYP